MSAEDADGAAAAVLVDVIGEAGVAVASSGAVAAAGVVDLQDNPGQVEVEEDERGVQGRDLRVQLVGRHLARGRVVGQSLLSDDEVLQGGAGRGEAAAHADEAQLVLVVQGVDYRQGVVEVVQDDGDLLVEDRLVRVGRGRVARLEVVDAERRDRVVNVGAVEAGVVSEVDDVVLVLAAAVVADVENGAELGAAGGADVVVQVVAEPVQVVGRGQVEVDRDTAEAEGVDVAVADVGRVVEPAVAVGVLRGVAEEAVEVRVLGFALAGEGSAVDPVRASGNRLRTVEDRDHPALLAVAVAELVAFAPGEAGVLKRVLDAVLDRVRHRLAPDPDDAVVGDVVRVGVEIVDRLFQRGHRPKAV